MKNILKSIRERVTDYTLVRKSELREAYETLNELHKLAYCDCSVPLKLCEYAKLESDTDEVIAEYEQQSLKELKKLLDYASDEKCFHALGRLYYESR